MIPTNLPDKKNYKTIEDYYQAVHDSRLELSLPPEEFIKYLKWTELKNNKRRENEKPIK